ncbi:MAG: hypothetical protein IBJ03_16450, partial [Gemmatimonadaceae bacterium]|nr:hypothetical protein [Gemmatimonadaceae bacterium]
GQQGQQGQQGQGQGQQGGNQVGNQAGGGASGAARYGATPTGRLGSSIGPTGPVNVNGQQAGTPEQFAREFRMRRENAEAVRREAAAQGVDTRDLDRAIAAMRQMENSRTFNDPLGLETLQSQMLERLKDFEFALFRSVGVGADGRPAVGASAQVPAEYRALVEEYYRSLAGGARKKP